MIQTIKKLFGIGPQINYAELVKSGAVILDVRTKDEYISGHIKGSLNIPLQNLTAKLSDLKKEQTIITCCASGMRSSSAKSILKSKGYVNVYNGGGWMSLRNKILSK